MNTIAGVYASTKKQSKSPELKLPSILVNRFPLSVSCDIDEPMHVRHNRWIKNTPAIIGAILGPI